MITRSSTALVITKFYENQVSRHEIATSHNHMESTVTDLENIILSMYPFFNDYIFVLVPGLAISIYVKLGYDSL